MEKRRAEKSTHVLHMAMHCRGAAERVGYILGQLRAEGLSWYLGGSASAVVGALRAAHPLLPFGEVAAVTCYLGCCGLVPAEDRRFHRPHDRLVRPVPCAGDRAFAGSVPSRSCRGGTTI